MYQLLTGIKAIHANRFIHRDIKPANILYDYTCQVLKIADFGLARGPNTQVDFKEDLSNEIETFMYRPPEIILGARQYDEKVDMWAAGVIFYTWIFWVLNPGETTWSSAGVGAIFTSVVIWLVWAGLKVWFDVSGGGSAVYGVLAGFIGLLLFLNLALLIRKRR